MRVPRVEEVSLPLSIHAGTIFGGLRVEAPLEHRDWIRGRLGDYGHDTLLGLLTGAILPAQAYYKAQKLRGLLTRQVHEVLGRCDVLVQPTLGKPAQRIADDPAFTGKGTASLLSYLLTFTEPLAGLPAISLPCGLSREGLPIGLQIAGPAGGEATVLKVAHAYEQRTPWHTMRPPAA